MKYIFLVLLIFTFENVYAASEKKNSSKTKTVNKAARPTSDSRSQRPGMPNRCQDMIDSTKKLIKADGSIPDKQTFRKSVNQASNECLRGNIRARRFADAGREICMTSQKMRLSEDLRDSCLLKVNEVLALTAE